MTEKLLFKNIIWLSISCRLVWTDWVLTKPTLDNCLNFPGLFSPGCISSSRSSLYLKFSFRAWVPLKFTSKPCPESLQSRALKTSISPQRQNECGKHWQKHRLHIFIPSVILEQQLPRTDLWGLILLFIGYHWHNHCLAKKRSSSGIN